MIFLHRRISLAFLFFLMSKKKIEENREMNTSRKKMRKKNMKKKLKCKEHQKRAVSIKRQNQLRLISFGPIRLVVRLFQCEQTTTEEKNELIVFS